MINNKYINTTNTLSQPLQHDISSQWIAQAAAAHTYTQPSIEFDYSHAEY